MAVVSKVRPFSKLFTNQDAVLLKTGSRQMLFVAVHLPPVSRWYEACS